MDDGAEQARFFTVAGELGGRPLPEIRVQAQRFVRMVWPTGRWGIQARVLPGQGRKDLLRDAIQAFSADARRRTVFGLGWREVEGRRAFLTAGGVVGADGVEVDVARDGLGRYILPSEPGDVRGRSKSRRPCTRYVRRGSGTRPGPCPGGRSSSSSSRARSCRTGWASRAA